MMLMKMKDVENLDVKNLDLKTRRSDNDEMKVVNDIKDLDLKVF